jgi:dephospho-CoA kinase
MNNKLVIGLTGRFGAGCTTTMNLLKNEYGFSCYSLSDPIKKIAKVKYSDFDKLKNFKKENCCRT